MLNAHRFVSSCDAVEVCNSQNRAANGNRNRRGGQVKKVRRLSVDFQNGKSQFRINTDQLRGVFLPVVKCAGNRVFVKDRAGNGENMPAVGNENSRLGVVESCQSADAVNFNGFRQRLF